MHQYLQSSLILGSLRKKYCLLKPVESSYYILLLPNSNAQCLLIAAHAHLVSSPQLVLVLIPTLLHMS